MILYKAEPVGGRDVPDIQITAVDVIPMALDLEKARVFYREQGRALARTLRASLPGGTYDALLLELDRWDTQAHFDSR